MLFFFADFAIAMSDPTVYKAKQNIMKVMVWPNEEAIYNKNKYTHYYNLIRPVYC